MYESQLKKQKGRRTVRPRPRQPRCKLARPPDGRHHRAVCERAARTSHTGAAPVGVGVRDVPPPARAPPPPRARCALPRPRLPRCALARPPDRRYHRAVWERAARTAHTGAAPVGVRGRRASRSATGASAAITVMYASASAMAPPNRVVRCHVQRVAPLIEMCHHSLLRRQEIEL